YIEAMNRGPLAAEKGMGLKVRLVDAKLHEDSVHRGPAQVIPAARSSIYGAMVLAGRILLEPIQKVFINVPQDFMGSAIGETPTVTLTENPAGGVCLCALLILTKTGHPTNVPMGHMNPRAPWDHVGAVDPSRVDVHSRSWMVPASPLTFQESLGAAGERIR